MVKTKPNDELLGFDLNGIDADYIELSTLAQRVRDSKGSLADDLVARAQAVLTELGTGEFLPGFEEMEKRATNGRGIAGQVVADVRVQIDNLRADIAVAVGEALLDRGQAAEAAALLEPIVKRSDDRDDVARTLSTALRELGQHDRAAEIRRRYAVGQES
jgi:pSer/pThr/pTyr-binding forkhead associated (FHA) protein